MHIVVIDPGFEDLHSHHANVNEGLFTCIESTGNSRLVTLAAMKLNQTTAAQLIPDSTLPFFLTPCYTNRLKPLDKEREQQLAEDFAEELTKAFDEGHIEPSSTLVLHTFFSFHLLGLAIWLMRYKTEFFGGIVLCGMFYPGSSQLHTLDNNVEFKRFLRFKLAAGYVSHAVAQNERIIVATSCMDFVESYQKLFTQPVQIHPVVTWNETSLSESDAKSKRKSILLYAGSVKQDKGLEFLLTSAEQLLRAFPSVEFIVHLNTSSPGIRDFQNAESMLQALLQKYPNLQCHFGYLSNTDYQCLLNQASAIVCHYDPQVYSHKTSGLLWDAMSRENMGVICTNDCWLSREYEAIGGKPFTFDYNNFDSLKNSLSRWLYSEGPFILPNHYYESLVKSFPEWLKQHCLNLHNLTKAG